MKRSLASTMSTLSMLVILTACDMAQWTPTGSAQVTATADCDLRILEDKLIAGGESPQGQAADIGDFFMRCHREMPYKHDGSLFELYRLGTTHYDYTDRSIYKDLVFKAPGDPYTLKLKIGLRPSSKPLPLVIINCGLQCGLDNPAMNYILALIADVSPFHVLLMPSTSSLDVQAANKIFTVGGFEEGQRLFKIAQWVQSDAFPDRDKISSVHVTAVSLGGHAALYAAIINGYNFKPDGSRYIKSFDVGSPVVELKASMEDLYNQHDLFGHVARNNLFDQVVELKGMIPGMGIFRHVLQFGEISTLIDENAIPYYKKFTSDPTMLLAPFTGTTVTNIDEFWKVNDLNNYLPLLKQNVLVWAAENDPIVKTDHQSQTLSTAKSPYLGVLETRWGSHCAFAEAYGWRPVSTIFRSILLSHMPEFTANRRWHKARIPFSPNDDVFGGGDISQFKWYAKGGSPNVTLVGAQTHTKCESNHCHGVIQYELPLSGFEGLGVTAPPSAADAEALTRWLNSNVWVLDQNGDPTTPQTQPAFMAWQEY